MRLYEAADGTKFLGMSEISVFVPTRKTPKNDKLDAASHSYDDKAKEWSGACSFQMPKFADHRNFANLDIPTLFSDNFRIEQFSDGHRYNLTHNDTVQVQFILRN